MEKMDRIVLFGFGGLILFGSIAQTFIQNETLKNAIVGVFYIIFVAIIFLTEIAAKLEASDHPHKKVILRDPKTGVGYIRDWFYGPPQPIGEGDLDPMGHFKYGFALPLVRPSTFPPPFGKVRLVFCLVKRENFEDNFIAENNGERIAVWNGIAVPHVSDICEAYLDPMPVDIDSRPFPVVLIDRTGRDALEHAEVFDKYHRFLDNIDREVNKELKKKKRVLEENV